MRVCFIGFLVLDKASEVCYSGTSVSKYSETICLYIVKTELILIELQNKDSGLLFPCVLGSMLCFENCEVILEL